MNETINATTNNSTNLTAIPSQGLGIDNLLVETLSQYTGISLEGNIVSLAFLSFTFLALYLILSLFTGMRKGTVVLSAYSPVLIIDIIAPLVGFPISSYELELFGYYYTTTAGAITLNLFDYIFSFGLFNHALPIISEYAVNVPDTSFTITAISLIYAFLDTIFSVTILTFTIYTALTLYENHHRIKIEGQFILSLALAFIPATLYSIFLSDPIHEFEASKSYISIFLSMFKSLPDSSFDIITVLFIGVISFGILSTVVTWIFQIGLSSFIKATGQQVDYNTDYDSIALIYSLGYSVIYVFHPEYSWYYIILVLIIWKIGKSQIDRFTSNAKTQNKEWKKQVQLSNMIAENIKNEMHPHRSPSSYPSTSQKQQGTHSNPRPMYKPILTLLTILMIALTILYIYTQGYPPFH